MCVHVLAIRLYASRKSQYPIGSTALYGTLDQEVVRTSEWPGRREACASQVGVRSTIHSIQLSALLHLCDYKWSSLIWCVFVCLTWKSRTERGPSDRSRPWGRRQLKAEEELLVGLADERAQSPTSAWLPRRIVQPREEYHTPQWSLEYY